jgi:hypothetical protein
MDATRPTWPCVGPFAPGIQEPQVGERREGDRVVRRADARDELGLAATFLAPLTSPGVQ